MLVAVDFVKEAVAVAVAVALGSCFWSHCIESIPIAIPVTINAT
jgi:hypothetical protein